MGHGQAFEQECCFPDVLCDGGGGGVFVTNYPCTA